MVSGALSLNFFTFRPGAAAHRTHSQAANDHGHKHALNSSWAAKRKSKKQPCRLPLEQDLSIFDPVSGLRLVQANVGTLNPRKALQASVKHCVSATPRTIVLDSLFSDADIVFVQEDRLQGRGVHKCYNFTMYRAPASEIGAGGVQIWLKHRLVKHVAASKVFSSWILRVTLIFGLLRVKALRCARRGHFHA